jgi:hypothetical protein
MHTIFSNLTDFILDGSTGPYIGAIAMLMLIYWIKYALSRAEGFFSALVAGRLFSDDHGADRMFERQSFSALKKCPSCSEELPLSALICHACDHNFLTGTIGGANRMLPAPGAQVYEMPVRGYAYRA